ncbi:MAG: sigma-70 family RNA polymerase sigma factor [Planctomycetota bacterium]
MDHSPIDAEFARFRRTRAPEALAAVFDATAPRLMLVALHLCRDAAAAEDLVQTVFVQALRCADQHDGRRPVLPWLLGILEHRARDLQARAFRRRERGDHPAMAGAAADAHDDPARRAADADVRRRVATALDGLPTQYRETLTLRLVHGLRAVEIARARGQSPATVRSHLRRGLLLLRRSLPRSLATPALLGLLLREGLRAQDGLPAIKAQLLQSLPVAAAPALAGAALAKWLLGGGAALVAAMLAVGALLQFGGETAAPLAGDDVGALATADATAAAQTPRRHVPPDTSAPRAGAGGERTLADATTVLHGRVVAAGSDAPMAGVPVALRTYPVHERGDPPADWVDPPPQTTAADGRFAFAFVPPRALAYEVSAALPGWSREYRSPFSLRPGIDADLGDLALHPATPVRLVVTVDGRPLPGFEVYANRVEDGGAPTDMRWCGDTDANGELDLGTCRPGRWRYDVRAPFDGPREGEFAVPLQVAEWAHRVELRMPPPERTITGTVRDQRGLPVEGLELRLPTPGNRWSGFVTATTADDGSFLFGRRTRWEGEDRWRFELPPTRTDLEWLDDGGTFAYGAQDLQLVVRRRAPTALRLEVTDARTGAPIERFGASCWLDTWRHGHGTPRFRAEPATTHPAGRRDFADLAPGHYRVSVFPEAPYAERTELAIELREGRTETLRVGLRPPAALRVQVRERGTGAALAGVAVTLARVVPEDRLDAVDLSTYRCTRERLRRGTGGSSGTNVIALDRADSDADGVAVLRAAPDLTALLVIAEGERCIAALRRPVSLPPDGAELVLEIDAAATLRGTLRPLGFVERFGPSPEALAAAGDPIELPAEDDRTADDYPIVELRAADRDARPLRTHVDRTGVFALGAIPPGRYRVFVAPRVAQGPRSFWHPDFGPLAELELMAGDARRLDLDVGHLLPARVTGRFFVDGEPWPDHAGVARITEDGVHRVRATVDADGVARSPWLVPGRYVPFVEGRADADRPLFGTTALVLAPGGEFAGTFDLQRRVVTVTVTVATREDEPAAARRVVLVPLDHPEFAWTWRYGALTGADGAVTFDPAPPGRLQVRAYAAAQDPTLDDTVPALLLGELGAREDRLRCRWP